MSGPTENERKEKKRSRSPPGAEEGDAKKSTLYKNKGGVAQRIKIQCGGNPNLTSDITAGHAFLLGI